MSVAEPAAKNELPRTMLRLPAAVTGPLIGLIAVLALFIVLIGIKGGLANFLSVRNLQVLVHEATIPGVVALGMLLVIISGGIDLSVGSILALVTVVTMQAYRHLLTTTNSMTTASLLAVAAGIAVGGLCGALNGLIITRLKLQPFVATLGMLGIARGVSIWLAGRTLIPFPPGGRPPWVDEITRVHAGTLVFNFTSPCWAGTFMPSAPVSPLHVSAASKSCARR
jgi:ribose transport system permease protein